MKCVASTTKLNQYCNKLFGCLRTKANSESFGAFIIANWRILAIISISVLEAVLNLGRYWNDSEMYISLSNYFLGKNPEYIASIPQPYTSSPRRPMIPFLASLLMPTLGAPLSYGIINTFFWVGAAIISYKTAEILSDKNRAFLVALFFTTSIPMIAYGSSILTDVGGYFAVGASLYLCLFERGKTMRRRIYFIQALLLALACLINEMAIAGLLFLLFIRAKERKGIVESLIAVGSVIAGAILIILLNPSYSKFIYKAFDFYTTTYISYVIARNDPHNPAFADALIWTYRINSPITLGYILPFFGLFASYILRYFFVIFIVLLALGLYNISEKKTTYSYLPFLALYVFVSRLNIERYLFVLWPVFVPALICGSHELIQYVFGFIFRAFAAIIRALSRLGLIANREEIETGIYRKIKPNAMERIHRLSSLALVAWLIYQAYCNTLDIALQFGLSPVLIELLRSTRFS